MKYVKAWWKFQEEDPREIWRYSEIDDERWEDRLVCKFIDDRVGISYRIKLTQPELGYDYIEINQAYLAEAPLPENLDELNNDDEYKNDYHYEYISKEEFEKLWEEALKKCNHYEAWLEHVKSSRNF